MRGATVSTFDITEEVT